jgi:hypothetical protein
MQTQLLLAALGGAWELATPPRSPPNPPCLRIRAPPTKPPSAEWVKTVAAKDTQHSTLLLRRPNAPAAIKKAFTGLLAMPGFALTFAPTKVEVARSGDLAYETGDYELTTNDKQGKPQPPKPNT